MVLFGDIYKNRKVLITGHTGFKGSWLIAWLQMIGADVIGYALPPDTKPNHFQKSELHLISIFADILNKEKLTKTVKKYQPEIIFHLAAQAIVKKSYTNPVETFETNIIGTANVFEAVRQNKSVKAIVNVTSDKCYENKEWNWPYRENDVLGGFDPYSASKAGSEIVTASYRNSFFKPENYGKTHNTLLASARAGNVIGGGDWGNNRLIPDIVKATSEKKSVTIRNPQAIRPWQHVLEALSAYLLIGQNLLEGNASASSAWNVSNLCQKKITVREIALMMKKEWQNIQIDLREKHSGEHEAIALQLDSSKIYNQLQWKNIWETELSVKKTVDWYKEFYTNNKLITNQQIEEYIEDAKMRNAIWING